MSSVLIDWDSANASLTPPRRTLCRRKARKGGDLVLNQQQAAARAKVVNERKRSAKKVRDQQAPFNVSGTRALLAVFDRRPDAARLVAVALNNARTADAIEAWESVLADLTLSTSTAGV